MLSDVIMPKPAKGRAVRALSRLAMLWLAFALLAQGFVVQTHAHFGGEQRAVAIAAAPAVATAATASAKKPGPATPACPLCEEQALFGAYLLGGSVAIAAPTTVAEARPAATLTLRARHAASHAWRSRAPPIAHA